MYIKKYCSEIFNVRSVLLSLGLPIIVFFILDYIKISELYKLNISLAIFCIVIPIAGFKSWKKYYKKSLLKIPEEYNTFLNSLIHKKQTEFSIKIDEDKKLSMIDELADDEYITNYKHNYNQNTKCNTHRITLTTKGKKYLEGRL